METNQKAIGYHTIWDVYGCDPEKVSWVEPVRTLLHGIVDKVQLGCVTESYKQFEPVGVTGFILLEESHISIHTWPEHNYAAIDIFSCKNFDVTAIDTFIKEYLETELLSTRMIARGESYKTIESISLNRT